MQWRLLEGVPDDEVRRLLSVARRRRFKRGEVVFHRDDPADSMHLVAKGRFAIRTITPLGDTVTVGLRGPGDNFGEMALVDDSHRRSATIEALEDSETFCVYHAEFQRLRKEHPQVEHLLTAFLAGEVRMLNERLVEALYLPVEKRVLRRLAELVAVYSDTGSEIPLTQDELASLAGTTRPTINQILRDEQARGTIELQRGRTIVLDRDEIARRAR